MFFHYLDVFRQLEKRLHDFGFRRLIRERGEQRVEARHAGGDGVAGFADFGNGGGSVHGAKMWRHPLRRKPGAFMVRA